MAVCSPTDLSGHWMVRCLMVGSDMVVEVRCILCHKTPLAIMNEWFVRPEGSLPPLGDPVARAISRLALGPVAG